MVLSALSEGNHITVVADCPIFGWGGEEILMTIVLRSCAWCDDVIGCIDFQADADEGVATDCTKCPLAPYKSDKCLAKEVEKNDGTHGMCPPCENQFGENRGHSQR